MINERHHYLVIRQGSIYYALPLQQTVQVTPVLPIVHQYEHPQTFMGYTLFLGQPIPMADLGYLLNRKSIQNAQRCVVVQIFSQLLALLIEEIIGVFELTFETVSQMITDQPGVESVGTFNGKLCIRLDISEILPRQVLDSIKNKRVA